MKDTVCMQCTRQLVTRVFIFICGFSVLALSLQRIQARAVAFSPTPTPVALAPASPGSWKGVLHPEMPASFPYLVNRTGDKVALLLAHEQDKAALQAQFSEQRANSALFAHEKGEALLSDSTLQKAYIYLHHSIHLCQKLTDQGENCPRQDIEEAANTLSQVISDVIAKTPSDSDRARLETLQRQLTVLRNQFHF